LQLQDRGAPFPKAGNHGKGKDRRVSSPRSSRLFESSLSGRTSLDELTGK
jgi:hypothetical protein